MPCAQTDKLLLGRESDGLFLIWLTFKYDENWPLILAKEVNNHFDKDRTIFQSQRIKVVEKKENGINKVVFFFFK